MNDRMTPIPFNTLMNWILTENGSTFGLKHRFQADPCKTLSLFGEPLEIPFGPAAGPHTQLAQNIITAYIAGARFFELKTVQTLDGEDLPVAKPCIHAPDECYNVEWSTELTVNDAFNEYVKAWFALKLLSKEWALGNENGFIFNMSVGYDLEGIQSQKIDTYIENLKNAAPTPIWEECTQWALTHLHLFTKIDADYIRSISPNVSTSITLSTLHGCPPAEIERIARYLIAEKKLHTYIKCNPTLLGFTFTRETLDQMGYDYLVFDAHHFKHDLQFEEAVPMFARLLDLSTTQGLVFGVKLTNTFPVKIAARELPGDEMYMSGRALFPLTISVAHKLAKAFDGSLKISFSGGADLLNIAQLFKIGIYPITLATTLLKPGGYQRLTQMATRLTHCDYTAPYPLDLVALETLASESISHPHYRKSIKPLPVRKINTHVPLVDCTFPPCSSGCPIHQDIPQYIRLCHEGNYLGALKVIIEKNPLPFITGTICNHRCMDKCRRGFYEQEIAIRDIKLLAAMKAFDTLLQELPTPMVISPRKVAIVGGGPAGLSAAYFLAKEGMDVTLFEKRESLGGIVKHIVPAFRIDAHTVNQDIRLIQHYGVTFRLGEEITNLSLLQTQGYSYIIVAIGATKPGILPLKTGDSLNVLTFLEKSRSGDPSLHLGKNVVVIGGGNTAMDAARAAKRIDGVENVSLVYRRTKRYMPADLEELSLALADGVCFQELLTPLELKDGLLTCQKMLLGAPDASGRRSPVATDAQITLPADTVIAAVGESISYDLFRNSGITLDAGGKVIYDASTLEIHSHIFIAGDVVNGPATVVEAIRDARVVADQILMKEHLLKSPPITPLSISPIGDLAVYEKKGMIHSPTTLQDECSRCLECDKVCECCVDVCPNRANIALDVTGSIQILHMDRMCNECGNCATFCPYNSSPYKEKFTLFHTFEDFSNSTNAGIFILNMQDKSFHIRLGNEVLQTTCDQWSGDPTVKSLIASLFDHYAYLV